MCEKKPHTVQTYGIWMRYDSRTGHHNMYREYRDVSVNGAVSKMYQDVASRHRSRFSNVQVGVCLFACGGVALQVREREREGGREGERERERERESRECACVRASVLA